MIGWASVLAATVVVAPAVAAPLFAFADPDIVESSGLVDAGSIVYTVNDSGNAAVLYSVDARTGETVERTSFADEVADPEALAAAPDGDVWVGDIGDNLRRRETLSLFKVTPGQAGAERYDLVYPDGQRDAETLLAHPMSGRLFVVSKSVFGGMVYAVPRKLDPDRPNRLREFAAVPGFLTDGAFLPSGRHVLLRGYRDAWLLSYPGFAVLATFRLPDQRQGEGLTVGPTGRVLLGSEGEGSTVLELERPDVLLEALAPPAATVAPPTPAGGSATGPAPGGAGTKVAREVLAGAGALLVLLGVATALRGRRHR